MSILTDIRDAVEAYAQDNVSMDVTDLIADRPNAISPDEQFTFDVIASNIGDPDGVAWVNVRFHVIAENAGVQLVVPPETIAIARAGSLETSALLTPGTLVREMFIFGIDPDGIALGVGDGDAIRGLKGQAGNNPGVGTIKAHFHGDLSLDAGGRPGEPQVGLFPTNRRSDNAEQTVNVV